MILEQRNKKIDMFISQKQQDHLLFKHWLEGDHPLNTSDHFLVFITVNFSSGKQETAKQVSKKRMQVQSEMEQGEKMGSSWKRSIPFPLNMQPNNCLRDCKYLTSMKPLTASHMK